MAAVNIWLEERDITALCTRAAVDKNLDGAGSELEVQLVWPGETGEKLGLWPGCGQWLRVEDGGETLFSGRAETLDYDAGAGKLTIAAFDPAALLARCQCYGPYVGTPADIARALCAECGLETGSVWPGDGEMRRLSARTGRSAFRGICQVYDGDCFVEWRGGKVHILRRGGEHAVVEGRLLLEGRSRNSAAGAVNQALVCARGGIAGQWEDRAGRLELGLRQKTLGLEAGELSPEEQAKAAIRDIAREGRIVLAGRSGVRCGQTVELDKPGMGLFGRYLVSETRWVCDRGKETTEMGLVSV